MKNFVVFCVCMLLASGAFAHSKLDITIPEDGAIVEDIPQSIELSFGKSIRLTKVEVIYDETAQGLDLEGKTSFTTKFSIPFLGKENGKYQINWRGLGKDGHAMKGNFSFEVK